jgi:hypothetical protein
VLDHRRPAPACCCRLRDVLHAFLRPCTLGSPHMAGLVGRHRSRRGRLTRYDEKGWRATFYTTGMEHSPTSATGTGWERTPWHTVQASAREALRKAE